MTDGNVGALSTCIYSNVILALLVSVNHNPLALFLLNLCKMAKV